MAQALGKGLSHHYDIEVIGRSLKALEDFEHSIGSSVTKVLYNECSIENKTVFLCVKPANLGEVAPLLKGKAHTLYSVLAGTSIQSLHSIDADYYVRAMPNLAAEVGQSMTSLTGDPTMSSEAIKLFGSIGPTLWVSTEKELDIATALAGSGPAYLSLIAEAFADGAVREGLKRDDAMTLMRGLFKGFGELIQTQHPSLLKDGVMSPGGTTAAGYGAMEKNSVRNGCMEAIHAAHAKAKEMGK